MRVISQDGTIDMPYEQIVIQRFEREIYCLNKNLSGVHALDDMCIAKYSTVEKAQKAIEELRYSYMCRNIAKMRNEPINDIDEKLYMGLNGVFQFPKEEEI